jgi:hypothetical protein
MGKSDVTGNGVGSATPATPATTTETTTTAVAAVAEAEVTRGAHETEEKLLDAATAALEDSTRFRKSFGEVSVVREEGVGEGCTVRFATLLVLFFFFSFFFFFFSSLLESTSLHHLPHLVSPLLCLHSSFFHVFQGLTEMEI